MKSLIIYFSRADENYSVGYIEKGNTEVIAEYIKELTNADVFKVEPLVPFSANYKTCCDEALAQQQNNERPPLKEEIQDISEYQTIYIGSPIYWNTMPQCMFTLLEKLDFRDKDIYVFTTHEGSGLGNVVSDVKAICQGGHVIDQIAIKGSQVKLAQTKIKKWLEKGGKI